MTESKAIQQLQKGSEEALSWLIHQYSGYVTTIIHRIIGPYMDLADIEEVASDVFFTLWQNGDKLTSVRGFLGATARNKAKNKLRELGHTLPLEEDLLIFEAESLEEFLNRKDTAAAVRKALASLPQPDRDIFLRYYFYYQTQGKIARQMDLPLSTVKSKLRRGKEKLKQSLIRYLA